LFQYIEFIGYYLLCSFVYSRTFAKQVVFCALNL
jgi:uncharacterized membrane protein (DUF106 family)